MATHTMTRPSEVSVNSETSPVRQAYTILHLGFTVAPILFGLDKFFYLMTDWSQYIAPFFAQFIPFDHRTFMMFGGVAEIFAGILVGVKPKYGAYLVAGWISLIIVNLVVSGSWFDIALRDFGLVLGALALGRLAEIYDR